MLESLIKLVLFCRLGFSLKVIKTITLSEICYYLVNFIKELAVYSIATILETETKNGERNNAVKIVSVKTSNEDWLSCGKTKSIALTSVRSICVHWVSV